MSKMIEPVSGFKVDETENNKNNIKIENNSLIIIREGWTYDEARYNKCEKEHGNKYKFSGECQPCKIALKECEKITIWYAKQDRLVDCVHTDKFLKIVEREKIVHEKKLAEIRGIKPNENCKNCGVKIKSGDDLCKNCGINAVREYKNNYED